MSKQINSNVLRVITGIDLAIAIPISLFIGVFGAVFTDGSAQPGVGIFMGVFTLVVLVIPAIICWATLRKRQKSLINQSLEPKVSSWEIALWILGFVFFTIPTLLVWLILRFRKGQTIGGKIGSEHE